MTKTGGELIVDGLKAQGVRRVFSVPGESYLAVLDALFESGVDNVVTRHESGAAFMAEAEGKMTGRPGVAFVTRGPGATNAAAGVHVAKQDSTPMVLFVGQVGRRMRGRDAFQEVDYRQTFGDLAKWVDEIDHADRIPEVLSHAWHVAMSGRPGPVVLALPEDMLRETAEAADQHRVEVADPAPDPKAVETFYTRLKHAKRPIFVLGGSRWTADDVEKMQAVAEAHSVPVATTFRRQPLFPADHPLYVGDVGLGPNPDLIDRVRRSDLLVLLGCRFSENPSQSFSLLDIPTPNIPLVHVHPGPEELGRIYAPDLAINATPGRFLDAVLRLPATPHAAPEAERQSYLNWTGTVPPSVGPVQMATVVNHLRESLPDTAIMTNGAGNYSVWLHRFWRVRAFDRYIGPTSGTMGYGLPAAIAAKLRHPDRPVVCWAGDGCFQMTSQEFGTAAQVGAAVVVLVFDNGAYGTIRMHQERDFPNRPSGTEIVNPDFAMIARAYGGHGETVTDDAAFGPAFDRAMASGKPAIIHIKTSVDAILPGKTLADLRSG